MTGRSALGVISRNEAETQRRRSVRERAAHLAAENPGAVGAVVVAGVGLVGAELARRTANARAKKAEDDKAAEEAAQAKKAEDDKAAAAKKARIAEEAAAAAKKAEEARIAEEARTAAKKAEDDKAAAEAKKKIAETRAADRIKRAFRRMKAEKARLAEEAKRAREALEKAEEEREMRKIREADAKRKAEKERAAEIKVTERKRIMEHQRALQSQPRNGASVPIELRTVDVADGILAYYAERAGLLVTEESRVDSPTAPRVSDTVRFVFERLCSDTIAFWKAFVEYQLAATRRLGHVLRQGAVAFQKTVELHEGKCGEKYDMWVAYVTNAEPTAIAGRKVPALADIGKDITDTTGIEMVVTVLVHRKAPVTSHIGIFRTMDYWSYSKPYVPFGHKGLAPLIHAFAAGSALYLYPHVQNGVMVTRPVPVMSKILRRDLGPGEITIGSLIERTPQRVASRKEKANKGMKEWAELYADIYTPPIGEDHVPFFVEKRTSEESSFTQTSTWTFGDDAYPEPEWMGTSECEHKDVSPRASDTLEHAVLLAALARRWTRASQFGRRRAPRFV